MTWFTGNSALNGRRVLVVEDEALIAMQIEAELEDAGFRVVGPAPSARQALRLILREAIDVAILDYRLGDDNSDQIAAALVERKIPFMLMTGHVVKDLPSELRRRTCLTKPVLDRELIATLETILAVAGND